MAPIDKTKDIIKKLPEHKAPLDFLGALLTIPVLITVLILNFNSINKKNANTPVPSPAAASPTLSAIRSVKTTTTTYTLSPTPLPTGNPNSCKKEIGPLTINYPSENQVVTDNSVCINIVYQGDGYCSVLWSYKINDSAWSDYSNTSMCIGNLQSGQNTFLLQVKSTVTGETQVFTRHFTYNPIMPTQTITSPTPTFTPTPITNTPAPTGAH